MSVHKSNTPLTNSVHKGNATYCRDFIHKSNAVQFGHKTIIKGDLITIDQGYSTHDFGHAHKGSIVYQGDPPDKRATIYKLLTCHINGGISTFHFYFYLNTIYQGNPPKHGYAIDQCSTSDQWNPVHQGNTTNQGNFIGKSFGMLLLNTLQNRIQVREYKRRITNLV